MKNYITLSSFIILFSNIFSQHTLELDTSWTSLLQNSAGTWVKFDEENNFYNNYSLFTASEGEAAAIRKLQKRNANNQLLWETSSRLKVIGFDYNNNPLCKCDHNQGGIYGKQNYLYRLNESNGNFIDSVLVFNNFDYPITSVQKYNGDFLIYGYSLARFNSNLQPIWIIEQASSNYASTPREDLSFIKNDSLFYVSTYSLTSLHALKFVKLSTGFLGIINNSVGADETPYRNTINCNGITVANNPNVTDIIKVNGSTSSILISGKKGYLLNVENQDEFLVLDVFNSSLSRCSNNGSVLFNVNLPSGFSETSVLNGTRQPIYYSNGYTYVFGKKNNHLCILTYDSSLNLINEFNDDGDPNSGIYWYSFDANSSGCFALVGQEFWGSKKNAVLVKFCTADASISEETLTSFSVYPNPTNITANIQFENIEGVTNLKVITLSGQTVIDQKIVQLNPEKVMSLDVSNLKNGIYFVKVGNHTEKLIIE